MDTFDRYVGQVFDNRYRIVKVIGIGGMAVVFAAEDIVMKRPVAVKMLKEEIAQDTQSVKRFVNESKAVAMLSHPNIVSIYDISVSDSLKYIVMEYIEGITLKSYIQRKGPLGFREIISFTEQTLRALEHAHSRGIIHRDIKPQNIMLLKNGQLKVADFGIAKLPNAETVTVADRAIGTVYYISPEQASGHPIDPRSDLYSLGVVMYEMATGKLPFVADTPVSVALMQINNQPQPPHEIAPAIPGGLEQIIIGAMEKDPDKRFQSAGQMLRFLTQVKQNPNIIFHESIAKPSSKSNLPVSGGKINTKANDNHRTNIKSKLNAGKAKKSHQRKQSRSMFPIILGVTSAFLLVIILGAAFLITKFISSDTLNQPQTIQIKEYVGKIYDDELRSELEATKYYKITVSPVYSTEYEENTIIKQTPKSGENRKVIAGKQYCDLTLVVSMGIETVKLEDYTALDYREVEVKLRDKGLISERVNEFNEALPLDYVFKTDPMPGTTVNVGDTVYIYVSKGMEIINTTVPNFLGTTALEASDLLKSHNLNLGAVTFEYSDEYERGQIIKQSKEPLSEVPQNNTSIDFVISLGKETPDIPETEAGEESTSETDESTTGPDESTTGSNESTTGPDESTTGPDESTTGPDDGNETTSWWMS